MENIDIIRVIQNRCIDKDQKKYLPCEVAFQIAKELSISVSVIGRICNENQIKIKHCQIGCF